MKKEEVLKAEILKQFGTVKALADKKNAKKIKKVVIMLDFLFKMWYNIYVR